MTRSHGDTRRGSIRITIVAMLMVVSMVMVPNSAEALAGCSNNADQPSDNNTIVYAFSIFDCSAVAADALSSVGTLQRHRAWGYQNIHSDQSSNPSNDQISIYNEYNCDGSGTFTYRTILESYDDRQDFYRDVSPTYRSAC